MNTFSLALASIRTRKLSSALCIMAVAAGVALLSSSYSVSQSIADSFRRNGAGIDMVIGPKGSPLQLVLSSVYHSDIPAGNFELEDAEKLLSDPRVRLAVPLVMGDSYRGWRLVGSTQDYLKLYKAEIAEGQLNANEHEAVAGALTDIPVGARFEATHGFSPDGTDVHHDHGYIVTGRLKPTGTVLDRLIVTDLHSIQEAHEHGHEGEHVGDDDHEATHEHEEEHGGEVTALLIQVRSRTDLINLPRLVNQTTGMTAAVPAHEIARLATSLGVGRDILFALSAGFVALSGVMLFGLLSASLVNRRYDLAVMRTLGASQGKIWLTVIFEGALLAGVGSVVGLLLGRILVIATVTHIGGISTLAPAHEIYILQLSDLGFLFCGILVGIVAAFLPAVSAARTDIAQVLAQGRT